MVNAMIMIFTDLWHIATTLGLFMVVGCLVAPMVFGIYCHDKRKEGAR